MTLSSVGDGLSSYLELSVGEFLERLASQEAAPGGGAVAALAAAMGAGLAAMAGRFSLERFPQASEIVSAADEHMRSLGSLATEDALAYEAVGAALALPKEPDPAHRSEAVRTALSRAADVPLAVAEGAAEVAALGLRLAREGNPNLLGDAVSACLLSAAAARSAAVLVHLNLRRFPQDTRHEVAEAAASSASDIAGSAVLQAEKT